jgi:hypothetical protein
LDEFLPIGRLFTLGNFLKITKVANIFGLPFSTLIWAKNGLGYALGDFFKNTSGHPGVAVKNGGEKNFHCLR